MSEPAGADVFLSGSDAALLAGATTGGTVDEEPAGGLPAGAVVGALSFGAILPSAGFGPRPGAAGVSTLPRMIGRPSLPLPMITIFVFGGLRERKRGLDATPTQVRIRNPLADRPLEGGYAIRLDLLAFRFLCFALDPEFVLLDLVELLGLAIDGCDDWRAAIRC